MQKRFVATLIALVLIIPTLVLTAPVQASPSELYSGPYFGEGNLPPGCITDMSAKNPDNVCHHMRTDMNGLDSPQIDVLVMVPVSPTAERDMRIMRQSIEMWEGGIDYLAEQMGMQWLADSVDFHVTVDYVDPDGGGGEWTTYPLVDPEIVVIATNPVGGIGIGVDPIDFTNDIVRPLLETDEDLGPCHPVGNPFDFEQWDALPGFDDHHGARTGTYQEDCGGSGGNVCFAVNGAIDPAPEVLDVFGLFDLVSHEVGHCLSIGHVGDGAEGAWGVVPTDDIMAYSKGTPELTKCVSTLDVEGIALRLSAHIDVDGDGSVGPSDRLTANDPAGDGRSPFQVQHPDDHLYASSTGLAADCPQPDLGTVPGERTDWTPTPLSGTGETTTATEAAHDDLDNDASSPLTEILDATTTVTATHVEGTIRLAKLWPSRDATSATSYSLTIDGRQFDSFVRYPAVDSNPRTWDDGAAAYMPAGTSSWDLATNTVRFRIPRSYLDAAGVTAPYRVSTSASLGSLLTAAVDDRAPELGRFMAVTAP